MVRAILEGRKTQTRRIVKPQPNYVIDSQCRTYEPALVDRHGDLYPGPEVFGFYNEEHGWKCPYGQPGDRLWVREAWGIHAGPGVTCTPSYGPCVPRKEGGFTPAVFRAGTENNAWGMYGPPKWRPSIHMPRTASRITLEIVSVRVERLQNITEEDAEAEGVTVTPVADLASRVLVFQGKGIHAPAVVAYADLWCRINGPDAWLSNPWVWVVEFKTLNAQDQATASE